jgi:stage III sporulation protein AD
LTLIKLCGICLLVAAMALVLRDAGAKLAPLVGVFGGVMLLIALIPRYRPILTLLSGLSEDPIFSSVLSLGLRAVALCVLVEVTTGILRDMGEGGLATRLEWCGRLELILLALPTVGELVSIASSYFS